MRRFEFYLGDGAYVYLGDGGVVVLYTSNGITETNTIVLELSVLETFKRWLDKPEAWN